MALTRLLPVVLPALVAASGVGPPSSGGPLSRPTGVTPAVGVVEVIYRVEPLELVGALMFILALWEGLKWFLVEAAKTLVVDSILKKLFG